MTAFINQRLVVVQLVIKPRWKDWASLMEFLIDILVDVDVGGVTLKGPDLFKCLSSILSRRVHWAE